jgi:hypothetical protein
MGHCVDTNLVTDVVERFDGVAVGEGGGGVECGWDFASVGV